jgi:hypothetical protein
VRFFLSFSSIVLIVFFLILLYGSNCLLFVLRCVSSVILIVFSLLFCLSGCYYFSYSIPALMLFRVHLSLRWGIIPACLSAISFVLLYLSFYRPSCSFSFPFSSSCISSYTFLSITSFPELISLCLSLPGICVDESRNKEILSLTKISKSEINRRMACPLMVRNLVSQFMGE